VLSAMQEVEEGRQAVVIGEITDEYPGQVYLETSIGGKRPLPLLVAEQLPRIC